MAQYGFDIDSAEMPFTVFHTEVDDTLQLFDDAPIQAKDAVTQLTKARKYITPPTTPSKYELALQYIKKFHKAFRVMYLINLLNGSIPDSDISHYRALHAQRQSTTPFSQFAEQCHFKKVGLCIHRDTPVFTQVMPQWASRTIDWTSVEQEMQLPVSIEAKTPKPLNVIKYPTYVEQMSPMSPPSHNNINPSLSDVSTPDTITVQAAAEQGSVVTRKLRLKTNKQTPRTTSEMVADRKRLQKEQRSKKRQREAGLADANVNVNANDTRLKYNVTFRETPTIAAMPALPQALALPQAVSSNAAVTSNSNQVQPQPEHYMLASFPNLSWDKSKLDSRLELGLSYTKGMITDTVYHSSNDGQTRKVRTVCKLYGKYPERYDPKDIPPEHQRINRFKGRNEIMNVETLPWPTHLLTMGNRGCFDAIPAAIHLEQVSFIFDIECFHRLLL